MIIVRMRVHATCVLIVTKPDASAANNQKRELSIVETDCSTSSGVSSVAAVVLRCKVMATTPTNTFSTAATAIVLRTPSNGSNTNPATSVPSIAPTKLHAYSLVIAFESLAGKRTSAAASTGRVAPINVVGISRTKPDSVKRHKLKLKYPG